VSAPELNCRDVVVNGPVHVVGRGGQRFEVNTEPDRPHFVTTDGVLVWMERKRQKTRFLDAEGNQVGPVAPNFVEAIVWARKQGWRDPSVPDWFNDAVIAEVAAGGSAPQPGQRGGAR
jgi:hypothetical protein